MTDTAIHTGVESMAKNDSDRPASDEAALAEAEAAEADALEAEALAEAARARARAVRLRQQADSVAEDDPTEETDEPDTGPAETDEPDDTDEPEAEVPQPVLRKQRRATVWTAAIIVAIFALLGISGYIAVVHHGAVQHRQRTAAFTAAARQGVINMTTLNYHHAEEDIQRLLDNSTGEFRDDFGKQADDFIKVAKQSQAVSEGTVNSAAVESIDKDSAVVLVAATSRVSNSAGAEDDPREWRLRVTVTRDGDQIKMSNLVYVP
jgi:Mce-associated membrane protein